MPESGFETYLSEISPVDTTWDTQRSLAAKVQSLYQHTELTRNSERMEQCSRLLQFALQAQDSGEMKLRLRSVYLCRVRHCPVCQWRRSMSWRARFLKAAPKIQEAYPTYRWVFITLTVKNCPLVELRSTVAHLNKSWQRLIQLKSFPAKGYVKALEVTRAKDDQAHPHIHALLLVPSRYFTSAYIKQSEWVSMWQKSARLDYEPSVSVKAIKTRSNVSNPQNKDNVPELLPGLLETLKYTVKSTDFLRGDPIQDSAWLEELTLQLHKTRAVAIGGILKEFIKDDEPEDLINVNESFEINESEEEIKLYFGWREMIQKYVKTELK